MANENPPKPQNKERATLIGQLIEEIQTDLISWSFESFSDGKVTREEVFKLVGILTASMYRAWEKYSKTKTEKSS